MIGWFVGVQSSQQGSLGLEAGLSQWPHQAMPPPLLPEHLVPETLQVIVCTSANQFRTKFTEGLRHCFSSNVFR